MHYSFVIRQSSFQKLHLKLSRFDYPEQGIQRVSTVTIHGLRMNLDWIGGRAVFEHHRLEIMAKGVHYRCQDAKMGGDPANRAKRHISFMQPLGKISLKKCREPGWPSERIVSKKNLPDPSRERPDRFCIYRYNDYMVDPLPTGTCDLPD